MIIIIHKNVPFKKKKLVYRNEGTFGDDGNVLKLGYGDGCTSLQEKIIELHT